MAGRLLETTASLSAASPLVEEIVRRLVDAYRPDRVYLFGSAARGDAGPNSDYDLLVVVPDDAPADRQSCAKGYEALRGIGVPRDVVVYKIGRAHV